MSPHAWPAGPLPHLGAVDCLGYAAAALVLATFSVTSMRALRCIAILSNLAFISYAVAAGLPPILVLHAVLLPTNIFRLLQLEWRRQSPVRPLDAHVALAHPDVAHRGR